MKTNQMITLVMLILLTGFTVNAQSSRKNTATTTFNVDMTCGACEQKVQKNIPFERGVKAMEINLAEKKVTVTYDTRRTNVEKLQEGFKKIGFTATEAKADGCCKTTANVEMSLGADPDVPCTAAEKKCCSEKTADAACASEKKCCSEKTADAACASEKKCCSEKTADAACASEKKCVALGADADVKTAEKACCTAQPASAVSQKICGKNG